MFYRLKQIASKPFNTGRHVLVQQIIPEYRVNLHSQ